MLTRFDNSIAVLDPGTKSEVQKLALHKVVPAYFCGDPSRPEVDRVMRDNGLNVFTMDKNAQRDRNAGTRRLIDLLVAGPAEGFPGIYITSRCERTLKEWKHYLPTEVSRSTNVLDYDQSGLEKPRSWR